MVRGDPGLDADVIDTSDVAAVLGGQRRTTATPGGPGVSPPTGDPRDSDPTEVSVAGPSGDWRDDRVAAAREGRNPTVLARLATGWAVIGDYQRLPGYCVLIYDGDADHLTDAPRDQRTAFLSDMAVLGEAVAGACAALDPGFARVNYEILGNAFAHLHAHVRARYSWEPPESRTRPVWLYPDLDDPAYALSHVHRPLRVELTAHLLRLGATQVVESAPPPPTGGGTPSGQA